MVASFRRLVRRLAHITAMTGGTLAVVALLLGCGGSAGGTAATSAPPGAISVVASEYKFEPATITAPPGSATFVVRNAGSTEHELRILKGDAAVGAVDALGPGASGQLTVNLEPGAYTYICKIAAHDQLGMKGTLTIGAS